MGSVGDAYDNAMAESFFSTLEAELLSRRRFASQAEAKMACFSYIEGWYNPVRLHLGPGIPLAHGLRSQHANSRSRHVAPQVHKPSTRSGQPQALAAGSRQVGKQLGRPFVQHRVAFPAGLMAQCVSQPAFPHAGRTADYHVAVLAEPATTGEWMHSELDDRGPITEATEPKMQFGGARKAGIYLCGSDTFFRRRLIHSSAALRNAAMRSCKLSRTPKSTGSASSSSTSRSDARSSSGVSWRYPDGSSCWL